MLQDLRFALRQLVARRGATAVALLTLSLAIGVTTAVFSVVNGVLLRPLPWPAPGRLVTVWATYPHWQGKDVLDAFWDHIPLAWPEYQRLSASARRFRSVAVFRTDEATVHIPGEAAEVITVGSSSHTLPLVLGVSPELGRWFSATEDRGGAPPTAVLRHEFWVSRLGADSTVLGRPLRLDDRTYTVIGVLPPAFRFARAGDRVIPDVWTALGAQTDDLDPGNHSFEAIARLEPGVTIAQAEAESAPILRGDRTPDQFGTRIVSRLEAETGTARASLLLLLGSVAVVLLIACVNLASLKLNELVGRDREMAVRFALGATRGRVVRLLLVEHLVLGAMGGALGLLLAWAGTRGLVALLPPGLPRLQNVHVDRIVLVFSFLVSVGAGLMIGVVPALRAVREELHERLKAAGRTLSTAGRLQALLVGSQLALTVMLLIGAGVLSRTLRELVTLDPGFRTTGLLTLGIDLPEWRYPDAHRASLFFDRLTEQLSGLPGVRAVASTSALPLSGQNSSNSIRIASRGDAPGGDHPEVLRDVVSDSYFATMRIPVLRGRVFARSDDASAAPVAVVSRTAANRLWPGGDPIGDRIFINQRWWTVVGIVEDVRHRGLDAPIDPTLYLPLSQWPRSFRQFVLHTAVPPASLAPAVRGVVGAMDPEVPIAELATMRARIHSTTAPQRARAILLSAFAMLSALLAGLGVYGVTAYAVAQRTRELGIRAALGANAAALRRLVLGRVVRVTVPALAVGLGAALLASHALTRFVYGVSARDPATYGAAGAIILLLALLAALGPARRATRVEPASALQAD